MYNKMVKSVFLRPIMGIIPPIPDNIPVFAGNNRVHPARQCTNGRGGENHHAQRTEPPHQGGPHTDRTPKRLHLRLLRQHLDIHRKVTLKVTNQPISAVLKQLFAGTDNTWKLSGRQIVIGRSVATAAATPRKITRITGVVRDQNNDPLIGVTIRIKARPNIGTATDINGKYLLDVYPDEVLEFSYVGYKSQDVSVAGQEIVDVVMLQNDAILDAVEVVGYGVQKKISVIGSQQTIATKELKVPVANLTQGLAGRVSGLVSVQRTSEPGFDDANIYIRGISTLTASMSAL